MTVCLLIEHSLSLQVHPLQKKFVRQQSRKLKKKEKKEKKKMKVLNFKSFFLQAISELLQDSFSKRGLVRSY